jgi:hypothetical protein
MSMRAFPGRGELARRVSGRLEVTLYGSEPDRKTSIEVKQLATGETVTFDVPRRRAYEAFYAPFAYLAEAAGGDWRDAA